MKDENVIHSTKAGINGCESPDVCCIFAVNFKFYFFYIVILQELDVIFLIHTNLSIQYWHSNLTIAVLKHIPSQLD